MDGLYKNILILEKSPYIFYNIKNEKKKKKKKKKIRKKRKKEKPYL
jgi:hypothetical protein